MKFKPILLLFVANIFLVFAFKSDAQNYRIGVKGGISIPNLTAGNSDDPVSNGYSSRLGPGFAIFGEFSISKLFSIQPQLEYSAQGGKKDGEQAFPVPDEYAQFFPPGQAPSYLYANYKSEAKLNYLMIPILGKFRFNLGKSFNFFAAGGPFVSFLLSAKNKTSGSSRIYADEGETQPLTPSPQSFNGNTDVKDDLKKSNLGVEICSGFSYLFGRHEIFIEGGGNFGFIKIQKDKSNGQNNTGAAAVTIGYDFVLKKK